MMVPLSEAVARRVPVLLRVMWERGERWAVTTLTASSLEASKRRTSPLVGGTWVLLGGAWDGGAKLDGKVFWGSG